jgi:hypothetical protein
MIIPSDPLNNAMDAVKAATLGIPTPTKFVESTANVKMVIDVLPKYKDGELIKKEAAARVMSAVADQQEEVLVQRVLIEEQGTETLSSLSTLRLEFPPKLPVINSKALAKKVQEQAKKKLRELKQSVSKQNLKTAKDAYKYPMKLMERVTPKVPDLPIL